MIEVVLPEKLSTNQIYNMHWTKKSKFKHDINMAVFVATRGLEPLKGYPLGFTYDFHLVGRELDIMNVAGMAKSIEDGLRYAGILENDSPKYVASIQLFAKKSDRPYNYCIITWQTKNTK